MKNPVAKPSISSKNLLGTLVVSLSVLAAISSRADVIFGFGAPGTITPINGPNGESITLTTQISVGNFTGFNNEFLYQYRVLVNAGSAPVDGFNLWTPSQAVVNAGGGNGVISQTAINFATTGAGANGGAVAAGNNLAASHADPGGAGPLGSVIPATPGAPPFNNVAGFIPTASASGNAISYIFATPPGNLNNSFNFDTTAAGGFAPTGQNVVGRNWGFTYWANHPGGVFDGNQLIRWFAINQGVDSLVAGDSMVFDAFSPFGPVAGGAFPDPPASEVFVSFDDINGDVTPPVFDTVTDVPEPSTWGLLAVSVCGLGWLLRRRPVRA